jgi:hypothetical protein
VRQFRESHRVSQLSGLFLGLSLYSYRARELLACWLFFIILFAVLALLVLGAVLAWYAGKWAIDWARTTVPLPPLPDGRNLTHLLGVGVYFFRSLHKIPDDSVCRRSRHFADGRSLPQLLTLCGQFIKIDTRWSLVKFDVPIADKLIHDFAGFPRRDLVSFYHKKHQARRVLRQPVEGQGQRGRLN